MRGNPSDVDDAVCFDDGLAVIVTSGLPPLAPELPAEASKPSASFDLAVLLAVASTSAMLLLKVSGMAPDPDESELFLNSWLLLLWVDC